MHIFKNKIFFFYLRKYSFYSLQLFTHFVIFANTVRPEQKVALKVFIIAPSVFIFQDLLIFIPLACINENEVISRPRRQQDYQFESI